MMRFFKSIIFTIVSCAFVAHTLAPAISNFEMHKFEQQLLSIDKKKLDDAIRKFCREGNDLSEIFAGAIKEGLLKSLQRLLPYADVNKMTWCGHGLLALSIAFEQKEILQFLLQNGANPNLCDNDGTLPLRVALELEDPDYARMLFEKGADANARDAKGRTLLAHAVVRNNKKVVELFLKNGARPNEIMQEENLKFVALDLAIARDHTDMQELLIKHGATGTLKHA